MCQLISTLYIVSLKKDKKFKANFIKVSADDDDGGDESIDIDWFKHKCEECDIILFFLQFTSNVNFKRLKVK